MDLGTKNDLWGDFWTNQAGTGNDNLQEKVGMIFYHSHDILLPLHSSMLYYKTK
jgi:hypothetical protein